MPLSAVTYNVLASAYIRRAWYPRTSPLVLDPAWRVPALVQHVANFKADLICLQEVEPETFAALRISLGEAGLAGQYASKGAQRPDGLAIFYRREKLALASTRVLAYADGMGAEPDSGYIALIMFLRWSGALIGVVDTHLMWDSPDAPDSARVGLR